MLCLYIGQMIRIDQSFGFGNLGNVRPRHRGVLLLETMKPCSKFHTNKMMIRVNICPGIYFYLHREAATFN